MAISSRLDVPKYHIRSISLPCESHPIAVRFECELNNLKAKVVVSSSSSLLSEQTICESLNGLIALYKCVDDLLNMPLSRQALSHCHNEKWVDDLLNRSVRVLDICGVARDMVSRIQEHFRDLQCALRRRKGDSSIESDHVANYLCFRKQVKKEAKRVVTTLKQVDITDKHYHDHDQHLIVVIRVLLEISEMTVLVFESVFRFYFSLVSSPKPRPNRWSIVSKLKNKGTIACEDLQGLESVDIALMDLCKSDSSNSEGVKLQMAQNRLVAMDAHLGCMDIGLESLFRCLISKRTLLLNILSH